jgi:site-specific DNA-methyltransferase (adenine-specific)
MNQFTLHHGDCYEVMKSMPDNSVDSIVTDPPYELGFMGKSWDSTGIAYSAQMWAEALRVLKSGGHLLAFSGSRTYHRMAVAIEDAGFEIRDQIMWVYGSGFPKSHNISKAIDKAAGADRQIGNLKFKGGTQLGVINDDGWEPKDVYESFSTTDEAKQWDGWGTALKPAHEPIVLARKPFSGTVAQNVLTHGTGALNIDASRVFTEDILSIGSNNRENGAINFGMADDKTAQEQNSLGRFPANFIHDGSDEVVALFPETGKSTGGRIGKKSMGDVTNVPAGEYKAGDPGFGDSGSAARFFYCAKTSKKDRNEGLQNFQLQSAGFSTRYCLGCGKNVPQAGSCGCNAGIEMRPPNPQQNHHPTVKPTALMRYLVRLVTPPNGIVLDPFLGSGSTGKACMYEKFDFIGIEMTEEYLPIAQARIEFAQVDKELEQDTLF